MKQQTIGGGGKKPTKILHTSYINYPICDPLVIIANTHMLIVYMAGFKQEKQSSMQGQSNQEIQPNVYQIFQVHVIIKADRTHSPRLGLCLRKPAGRGNLNLKSPLP